MSVNTLLRDSRLSWLAASGKDSDVVLASRIRLARNFRQVPFPNRADFNQLAEVRLQVEKILPGIASDLQQDFDLLDMERLSSLQRDVLVEKQLISNNFIQNPQHRVAFITEDCRTSIMINEEDHLRIQCMAPGLDLDTPFAKASHIDDMIEDKLDIAFDEKMGYLTSCPTNLAQACVLRCCCICRDWSLRTISRVSSTSRRSLAWPSAAFTETRRIVWAICSRYPIS